MVLRTLSALAALAVAAWFGLGLYQSNAERQAGSAVAIAKLPSISPAEELRIDRLLDRASLLNPDVRPELYRAFLAFDLRQYSRSLAILRKLVRREPQNIELWAWLGNVARGRDQRLYRLALARENELRPPVSTE